MRAISPYLYGDCGSHRYLYFSTLLQRGKGLTTGHGVGLKEQFNEERTRMPTYMLNSYVGVRLFCYEQARVQWNQSEISFEQGPSSSEHSNF